MTAPKEALLGYWDKHPKKDGEDLLEEFHHHGWRITRKKKYYVCYCPPTCGLHMKTVHLSPDSPYHWNHVRQWVGHLPCWQKEDSHE